MLLVRYVRLVTVFFSHPIFLNNTTGFLPLLTVNKRNGLLHNKYNINLNRNIQSDILDNIACGFSLSNESFVPYALNLFIYYLCPAPLF